MENRQIQITFDSTHCTARIIKQSHIRSQFVPEEYARQFPHIIRANGFGQHFYGRVGGPELLELASEGSPQVLDNRIYMWGRDTTRNHNILAFSSAFHFEQFLLSVAMYNAMFNCPTQIKLSDVDFRKEWKW